jgi:hypothetical protein
MLPLFAVVWRPFLGFQELFLTFRPLGWMKAQGLHPSFLFLQAPILVALYPEPCVSLREHAYDA